MVNPSHKYKVVASPLDDIDEAMECGPYEATDSDEVGTENVKLPETAGMAVISDELFFLITVFRVHTTHDEEIGTCKIHRLDPRSKEPTAYALQNSVGETVGGIELVLEDLATPAMCLELEKEVVDRPDASNLVLPNQHEYSAVILVTKVADLPGPKGWNELGYGVATDIAIAANCPDVEYCRKEDREHMNDKPVVKKPFETHPYGPKLRGKDFDDGGVLLVKKGVLRNDENVMYITVNVHYIGQVVVEDEFIGETRPIPVSFEEGEVECVQLWGGSTKMARKGCVYLSCHLVEEVNCHDELKKAQVKHQESYFKSATRMNTVVPTFEEPTDPQLVSYFFPRRARQLAEEAEKRRVLVPKDLKANPIVRDLIARCEAFKAQNSVMKAQVKELEGEVPESGLNMKVLKHWPSVDSVMASFGPHRWQEAAPVARGFATALPDGTFINRTLAVKPGDPNLRGVTQSHAAKDMVPVETMSGSDFNYLAESRRVPGCREGRRRFTDINPGYMVDRDVWGATHDEWKTHELKNHHGESELDNYKHHDLTNTFRTQRVKDDCILS